MAQGLTIQVEGLKQLQKKLGNLPEHLIQEFDAELADTANGVVNRAVEDAPRDQGILIQGISFYREDEMQYVVVSGAEYSAYIEFGTRTRVQVPAELQDYANQFRLQNTGGESDVKKIIYEWCRRKGIEERYWYPIFIKIMTVGVNPHPFFFPQMRWAQTQLNKNLRQALKRAIK